MHLVLTHGVGGGCPGATACSCISTCTSTCPHPGPELRSLCALCSPNTHLISSSSLAPRPLSGVGGQDSLSEAWSHTSLGPMISLRKSHLLAQPASSVRGGVGGCRVDSKCVFSPFLTGTLGGQADSPPGFPLGGVWESSSVTFPDHQGIQLSAMALKHSQ